MRHLEISKADQRRLAGIRAQMRKWAALYPKAMEWDAAFLLRLYDELKQQIKQRV